jgi:hypothetical protein
MRAVLAPVLSGCVVVTLAGCVDEYRPETPPRPSYSVQNVSYPTTVVESGGPAAAAVTPPVDRGEIRDDGARVLVLESTHLDRPAEVVGVVDAHVPMGSHDAALDVLRRRAAQLGADAVVGVEFHHGEGEGQPTHLSGLAVRFLNALP